MYFGLILVAAGLFTICGAAFNWDFAINSFKSRFWVNILGRTNARIFYDILGIAIVAWGCTYYYNLKLKTPHNCERRRKFPM